MTSKANYRDFKALNDEFKDVKQMIRLQTQGIDEYLRVEIPWALQKLLDEGFFKMTSLEFKLLSEQIDKLKG